MKLEQRIAAHLVARAIDQIDERRTIEGIDWDKVEKELGKIQRGLERSSGELPTCPYDWTAIAAGVPYTKFYMATGQWCEVKSVINRDTVEGWVVNGHWTGEFRSNALKVNGKWMKSKMLWTGTSWKDCPYK